MAKDYSNYKPLSWMQNEPESKALTEVQTRAVEYASKVNSKAEKPLLIRPAWYKWVGMCNHVLSGRANNENYCLSQRLAPGSRYCVDHDHLYQPLYVPKQLATVKKKSRALTTEAVVAGIVIPGVLIMVCGLQAFSLRNFIAWAILMTLYHWIIWTRR